MAGTDSERPVELYVYDLSQGMARQFSLGLLGTFIDAIYHTSIVLGGREYYYGQGIQFSIPGGTHHGNPMEKIHLGVTSLTDEIFLEYLDSLKPIYSPEAYDLFQHNCNNFTNDVAQFLCGRGIPDHIVSLPQTVLNTPFGQMLKPQLEQAMRPITTAPTPHAAYTQASRDAGQHPGLSKVITANSLAALEKALSSAEASCAVVFFTSSTCGPCRSIYPHYEELAADAGSKAKLIKCDIGAAPDAALRYEINSTPTFVTFLKGEKVEEWVGAGERDLQQRVDTLLRMAYPPHPHTDIKLPITLSTPMKPITFTKVPPLGKVTEKLGDTGKTPIIKSICDFIATRNNSGAIEAHLPNLSNAATFLRESFEGLPADKLFPLIDLFRLILSDVRVSGWFAEEKDTATIKTMLSYAKTQDIPYSLRLVTLQASCNLFSSPLFAAHLTSPTLLSDLVNLITTSLLDRTHTPCRVAASSLVFNLATYAQKQRSVYNEEVLGGVSVDILASVVEALKAEEDSKEVVKGLVLSLALMCYCVPLDGEVKDFLEALEAGAVVRSKCGGAGLGEKGLCEEVARLLEA